MCVFIAFNRNPPAAWPHTMPPHHKSAHKMVYFYYFLLDGAVKRLLCVGDRLGSFYIQNCFLCHVIEFVHLILFYDVCVVYICISIYNSHLSAACANCFCIFLSAEKTNLRRKLRVTQYIYICI